MNEDRKNPIENDQDFSEADPAEVELEDETTGSRFLYVLKEVCITLLLFLLLRNFVVQARFIPSGSMLPGLEIGDRLLVEHVSKYFGDIERGDILVFYKTGAPTPSLTELISSSFGMHDDGALIKRVVGLPGDTIEVVPNTGVKVNGKLLEEEYIFETSRAPFGPVTVPQGHFFMMGDNRNQSADSRSWGMLPEENVIGEAFLRFYPFDRFGLIE